MVSGPPGLSIKSSHVSGNQRGTPPPSEEEDPALQANLGNSFLLAVPFEVCVTSYPTAGTPSLLTCGLVSLSPFCWGSAISFSKSQ